MAGYYVDQNKISTTTEMQIRSHPTSKKPSYIEYMIAAFGTTRIKWALRPLYNVLAPSSARTSFSVCHRPVYLTTPLMLGCRSRVRRTS